MKRGKKYRKILESLEKNKLYSVDEALKIIKKNKSAKFDEAVEVHLKLGINPKKGEEQMRGSVVLPFGIGKTKRIAVATSIKTAEAKEAGADLVGAEDLIEKIKAEKIDFDVLVATSEMMPKLAPVAKILGPRGLMPNAKTETITDKIKETVEMLKKGKINFKNDDTANIHQVIGRVSFEEKKLKENYEVFLDAVKKAAPAARKGKLILNISICSTMGPGIKINF